MASLNLSINGPSIKSSYQGVINGPALSSTSPTAARWALFTVQAPLLNAFQNTGAKESILKVESTGDGELAELVEEFNEGRIQFAFVRVKDPNTGLPKNILIAWCGGGVPERTKGYFTSHVAAVSKVLHGYHVQITARSDADLAPEDIMQKVADASGAKYSAGGSTPTPAAAPPPVAKKPVFTPTTSVSGSSFNPPAAARNRRPEHTDDDGWGADAPPVTRTELEKVEPAYKPTKVDIAALRRNNDDSRFNGPSKPDDRPSDIVKGGYQPVGKVDIAALRAQASQDDRPTVVKGAYEPVGKVDIAAIRARTQQRPTEPEAEPAQPKSLAERSAAFTQSERLTELPKPKVAKAFGGTPFTGTKAPTPVGLGFGAPSMPAPPPVGAASRTFADQDGKTPAQLWAEKKARQGGAAGNTVSPPVTSPIAAQKSGSQWKSGYSGKTWAPVQTTTYGRGGVEKQKTGGTERSEPEPEPEQPVAGAAGVSALRDRFKDAAPMGTTTRSARSVAAPVEDEPAPPPLPSETRPAGGFALPGLSSRPAAANQEEEEEKEAEAPPSIPSRNYEERESSPVRVAMPVPRSAAPAMEPPAERLPPRPVPVPEELPKEEELPTERESNDPRAAAAAVAAVASSAATHAADSGPAATGASGGRRALIQYDYEKAEDNEIELREGEYVTNIEMVDDDWWMGTNAQGETGLFPSNYVELVDDDERSAAQPAPAPAPASVPAPAPAAAPAVSDEPEHVAAGPTATAQFDYEAAEDNELSFPEGAKITNLEFPDEDWWFGHYGGASGLFPANYVQLDS
ncbi:caf4f37d-1e84-45d7-affc-581a60e590b6 [Thermothielavioides terrestris]|uniref:Caf4f37d-1e84-45d7-affc-581a60e590b6 n=1 Tax=Thermothielavioides terrestris TaxID=2587410 RepID=A0A446B8U3_9PEZI|nr:caf4f37d-1e84-45d7-affc-581a60e590b6 [Thermothielavioides terrestris]